jgi:hypothetical protein
MPQPAAGAPAAPLPPTLPWWPQTPPCAAAKRELLGQVLTLQQIGQWRKDLGDFWQKPPVKIYQVQKSLQILNSVGLWKIVHHLETACERCDTGGGEAVSQKIQLRHCKLALLQVDGQAVVRQALKHSPRVRHVLLHVPAGHLLVI